jgi:hypothetical protein
MSSAMSSQRPPHPPISPQQTRVDSASEDYSDFPPIRVIKTPDPSSLPRCSPVARRQSERQFRVRRPPNSVAQRWSEQLSSSSKEPVPSRSHRYLPNSGLGNWNRLNTMEASVLVLLGKCRGLHPQCGSRVRVLTGTGAGKRSHTRQL